MKLNIYLFFFPIQMTTEEEINIKYDIERMLYLIDDLINDDIHDFNAVAVMIVKQGLKELIINHANPRSLLHADYDNLI
jgi:hypothetical protein